MNKRALMLTAAATALLSGPAFAASPCASTPETAGTNCDLQTEFQYPIYTGTVPAPVTTANSAITSANTTNGSVLIDTNGSLVIGINPPIAPAVTINSGTTGAPTFVNNATTISYQGISYATGVLLEEASVAPSATTYGTAENWVGEYYSATGTMDLLGAGTNKTAILIAGGAYPGAGLTNASTGIYASNTGPTTGLGLFTGATGGPQGGSAQVAIYLANGSTTEVQGTNSNGISLIGPTYSQPSGSTNAAPFGGASLLGDIDVGGTLAMTPTTVGSTAATDNIAINIAGWMQSAAQPNNPAFAGTAMGAVPYAMVGNLNILSGGTISSEGEGAEGIVVVGAMNGAIVNQGQIETFGTTTPSTAINASDPEAGSALAIGNNITGGIFNSGPSAKGQASTPTGTISTVGTSPTIYISPAVNAAQPGTNSYEVPITIGVVQGDPDYPGQFSLLNRGTISAASEDPNQNTNAIVIQGASATNNVTLTGGIFNSGTISANATTNTASATTSVTATALTIGADTNIGTGTTADGTYSIINSVEGGAGAGRISASVSGPDVGIATAINIAQNASGTITGANPTGALTLFNSGTIIASATTTEPTQTGTLNAFAISDSSGTLTTITNQGAITAAVTTLDSNSEAPINSSAFDQTNEAVAIYTANNSSTPVTVNDTATASGPASISGDIFFGTKNGTLNVNGLNSAEFASVEGNVVFENTTSTHDKLNIGTAGTVSGQIAEKNGGIVDIAIAQSGALNYQTVGPTNLNATVAAPVTKGVPLSVGQLTVNPGGQLNISISQGYNVNVYPGVSVLSTQAANIGDPVGGIHPLTVTFGSYVATPSATGAPAEFVLVDSRTNIVISQTALTDLTNLYSGTSNSANGIPFLFNSNICTFNVSTATGAQVCSGTEPINSIDSQLVLTLTPKTAQQLGLTGYAAKMFPYVNQALINDNTLGSAMVTNITNRDQAQAAYASFAPDVSGATRATVISLTDSATNVVAARQRELRMYANQEGATTLWGQQFAQRLSQANTSTLTGYNDSGFGFVVGMDDGDRADGRYGGAFTFFTGGMSQKEPTSAKTSSEYYLLTGYTDWRGKGLFIDTQGTIGYGNLKGKRFLDLTDSTGAIALSREAQSTRASELLAGSITTGSIFTAGGTVFMPQVDLDGMTMREEGYTEAGGGEGFDLRVQPYYADSLRAFIGTDVRQDFNFGDFYLQPEIRAGYRYDFVNGVTKLKANFPSVSALSGQTYTPFSIEGPDPGHGNLVLGGGVATTTGAWSIGLNFDYVKASNGPAEQTGVLTLIGRI